MTRTLATLATLTALVTFTACDAPDAADAEARSKVLHADAASLAVLAESDSEIHDRLGTELGMSGDGLLARALDPEAFPDMALTTPPRPSAAEKCVGITDFLDFCYDKRSSGVYVWIEVLGVASPKDWYSQYGMCDGGGLDVGVAKATYTTCYLNIPVVQLIFVTEACWFGDCADYAYVKVF